MHMCVRYVNQCKCHVRVVAREYFVANTTIQCFIIYLDCNAALYAASAASRCCCTSMDIGAEHCGNVERC